MDTYTVCFFGHREIDNPLEVEEQLYDIVLHLLESKEYVEFLVGRNGEFDQLVSSTVRRVKRNYRDDNSALCRITIHLGQVNKKRMKDRAKSVKVELPHNNLTKGGHILHGQEYNTGHGVQAILNEIRGEIRRQPCQ